MKLDQYVISCVKAHPTLYHAPTYQEAKMKVLDQFLNVIGNGIRDNEELAEELEGVNTKLTMEDILPIVSGAKIFTGYTEVETFGGDEEYSFPKFDSRIDNAIIDGEQDKYPEVVHWTESSYRPINLYPNFKEDYSTVYQCPDYLKLDESFIDGAIEYYEFALKWFEENEGLYHYAFPCADEKETERRTKDMMHFLESDKYDSWEAISEAYETEYKGDVYQFQVDRWQKEKKRVLEFIKETLVLLKNAK